MNAKLEEIDEWCIKHGIPLGEREDLVTLIKEYAENEVEDARKEACDHAYSDGYTDGKRVGHAEGFTEGDINGKEDVLSRIENDVFIPHESRRDVLKRFGR